MSIASIYLAGPIMGCDKGEANDWRRYVDDELIKKTDGRLRGISPLRCEPLVGERYTAVYADPKFGTARAIGSKNFADVQRCDMTLAYFPKMVDTNIHTGEGISPVLRMPSLGTIIEIGWAFALRKPTIVVTNDKRIYDHPVVNTCAGWLLEDLDDGVEVLVGILDGYYGGKNI